MAVCVCVFQNSDGEDVVLGVSSEGILLYRDDIVESKFLWPRVLKVSYKHSKFLFRTHPSEVVLTEQIEVKLEIFSELSSRPLKVLIPCVIISFDFDSMFSHKLFLVL